VKSVALVNTPAVDLSAELFVSYGTGTPANPTGCNGVAWSVNVGDHMALTVTDLVNYVLFDWHMPPYSGCIGRKVPVVLPPVAATTTSDPIPDETPPANADIPSDSGLPYLPAATTSASTPTPTCYGTANLPDGLASGTVTDGDGQPYVIISGALLSTGGAFATVSEPSLDACLLFCKTWGPSCQFVVYDNTQLRSCALLGAPGAISLAASKQAYAYSSSTTPPAPNCDPVVPGSPSLTHGPGSSPTTVPSSSTTGSAMAVSSTTSSSVAATSSAAPVYCPVPTSAPHSLGCYYASVFTTPFDPSGDLVTTSETSAISSIEGCIAHCNSITSTYKTFAVVGLAPGYCFCQTSATLSPVHKVADSLCSYTCNGNGAEICGGVGDQATFEYTVVYANTLQGYAGCTPAPVPSQITAPAQINCFNNYHDGKFYKAANGNTYQIHCHMYPSGDDIQLSITSGSDTCVELCSKTPSCVATAWVAANDGCFLKSVRSPLPAAISDASQGKEVDMVVLVSAPLCSSMTCPLNDGSYCMSNGNLFQISCYTWYQTSALGTTMALSLGACMDYCTSTFGSSCHGANFFTTTISGSGPSYNCAPFSVANTPNPPYVASNGGISAIDLSQLNQGYGPHPLAIASAPSDLMAPAAISCSSYTHDGAKYTTPNGITYQIACHAGHWGDDMSKSTSYRTFDQCLAACSTNPGCVAVDWIPSQNGCLMKSGRTTLPGLAPDLQTLPSSETTAVQCIGSTTVPPSLASGTILDQDGLPYTIISGALLVFISGQPFATAPEPSLYACLLWCNSWGPMCAIANFDPFSYQSCQLFQVVTSIVAASQPNQGYAYKRQPANISPPCTAPVTATTGSAEVDSAFMISAPSCDTVNCPGPSGGYCSTGGMVFEISCNTIYGTSYSSAEVAPTLGACLAICASKGTQCKAVDFYPPIYPGENSCLMVSTLGNPVPAGDRYGGFSAISLASLQLGFGPVVLTRDVERVEAPQIKARIPAISTSSTSTFSSMFPFSS
jgi:WSC domain/PAN domain